MCYVFVIVVVVVVATPTPLCGASEECRLAKRGLYHPFRYRGWYVRVKSWRRDLAKENGCKQYWERSE